MESRPSSWAHARTGSVDHMTPWTVTVVVVIEGGVEGGVDEEVYYLDHGKEVGDHWLGARGGVNCVLHTAGGRAAVSVDDVRPEDAYGQIDHVLGTFGHRGGRVG